MTDDEVRAFLRAVRYSDNRARYARKALSINAIATKAASSREAIYATLRGKYGPSSRVRKAVEDLSVTRR